MLPLLALLPTIFSTIAKVPDLFKSGKEIVQQITGSESKAETLEELSKEIENMPPEQQAQWAEAMQSKIKMYEAQTERLKNEQGEVGEALQAKVSQSAADKITILRQTTRPWAVRQMIHYLFMPFYLVIFDTFQLAIVHWFNIPEERAFKSFDYVFGALSMDKINASVVDKVVGAFMEPQALTLASKMYIETTGWAAGIVLSYMALREVSKAREHGAKPVGQSIIDSGLSLLNKFKK